MKYTLRSLRSSRSLRTAITESHYFPRAYVLQNRERSLTRTWQGTLISYTRISRYVYANIYQGLIFFIRFHRAHSTCHVVLLVVLRVNVSFTLRAMRVRRFVPTADAKIGMNH